MYDELIGDLYLAASGVQSKNRRELLEKAANAIKELSRENESLAKSVNEASEILRRRWIPLTKCLPEAYEDVLLLFPNNQAAGFCDRDGCWGVYSGNGFCTEVTENDTKPTHWAKKLPDPPKEGRA